ncbi:MAG: hypothetical protein H0X66_17085 [Verrucomicrobia bacterium]|jgi:hypothetical protein|nr:hypothetical protein [Verrucomicrobiota bacterium]
MAKIPRKLSLVRFNIATIPQGLCRFSFSCNDDVRFVNNGTRAEKAAEDYLSQNYKVTDRVAVSSKTWRNLVHAFHSSPI